MGDLAKKTVIEELLNQAIRQKIGSGMAAAWGTLDAIAAGTKPDTLYLGKTAWTQDATPVGSETVFDLASLTKIMATTLLAMVQYESGQLKLDATLAELRPDRVKLNPTLAPITVRQLLTHTSGLPAWKPFYEEMRNRFGDDLYSVSLDQRKKVSKDLVYQIHRENEPGEKVVYSDLGFLILEDVLSQNFEQDVMAIWKKIPGCHLHFRPVVRSAAGERQWISARKESVAVTEACPWRGLLQGQVHDDNTWSFGGVAGHAGVFGTLKDVIAWMSFVFTGELVSFGTLSVFFEEAKTPANSRRALGFDLPSLDGSGSTGFSFSSRTVGHLGFSGTSLWVDLSSGDYAILLTNRVHPTRNDNRIRPLRRVFHFLIRGK